ncbi:hypothetical protein L226DRAFT_143993 [Lentinus tigrinus ALCF2SS1-7]|uniref:uncharacterized protein n=1 Tax=Lentinus tigrinus ALCF2SS1-7 TaxID=1328758 RepID=UPI0011661CCB|nr:hypothetical protein L226DRAFT_143993 [Lentinus tigrinus ALCF2SS1-7]
MWPPSRFGTLSAYYALLPTSYLSDPAYPSPHRTPRRWLLHAPLLRSDILALHIDTDHASPTGDQVSRLAPPRGDFPSSSRSCTHLQNHAPTSRGVIDLDRNVRTVVTALATCARPSGAQLTLSGRDPAFTSSLELFSYMPDTIPGLFILLHAMCLDNVRPAISTLIPAVRSLFLKYATSCSGRQPYFHGYRT